MHRTWRTTPGIATGARATGLADCEDGAWCEFCAAPKPQRTYHCRICNACVYRRDHHCDSLDNCIGIGNHGIFVLLLTLQVFASSYYMWLYHQSNHLTLRPSSSGLHVFGWARQILAACLYGLALSDVVYVGRLLIWQWAYLYHDVTTLEHLRVVAAARSATNAGEPTSERPGLREVYNTLMELKSLPALPPPSSQPAEGGAKLLLLVKAYGDDIIGLLGFLRRASLSSIRKGPCDVCTRLRTSTGVACGVLFFGCKRARSE